MAPWLTVESAYQLVKDVLKQTDDLDPYWKRMTAVALSQSSADILGVLRGRAYSAAQLDSMSDSDRLGIATSQFLFRILLLGTGLGDFSQAAVTAMDVRKQLAEMFAVADADGDAVAPAPGSGNVGGYASGTLDGAIRLSREWDCRMGDGRWGCW